MKVKLTSLQRFNTLFLSVVIFFVLLTGSIFYFLNYEDQITENDKIEFTEYRLNELNEIYINFLKAIRDNRGYRLYQVEAKEKDYYTYRDRVLSLIKDYTFSAEYPQDSILFSEISELILLRFKELDEQIERYTANPSYRRSNEEVEELLSQANQLELKKEELTAYLVNQSQIASENFTLKNERNDKLFLLWIVATGILAGLFILTYSRKVKSQFRQSVAEETLDIIRQKEQEFSTAFDYASIGMALVSTEGAWLRVNRSLCQLLGYTESELVDLTFQDITHPEDLNKDLGYVEQMLKNEIDTYQMEKRYFTKNGSLVWVLLSVSLVIENGKPKYFISQIQDITLQKTLEEQLLAEKLRLQQVIDGTDAGTWEWNVQSGETIFNEKWANMLGYTLAELEPTTSEVWNKFVHPEDLETSNQSLQDCFEKRSDSYKSVYRMRHRSGEWIWVMDRGKVMTWTSDGKPELMFGSHIDITSMKRLEESLELQRHKFTTIFNSSSRFIGFLALDGTLLEANETALNFAGLQPSDVIGKKFWDCYWWLISEETQEQLKEAIQVAASGEAVNYEVAVWDKNKNSVTILFNLKPLKNQEGKVVSIIPEGTQIQDLIDYRTKLEAKNEELEGFAAIAAHDLKEPLRMISQFMDRLSRKYEDQLDEMAQKYIYMATDGAKRMNDLINDLLAYAEIGGAGENSFEQVDLNLVYDETVALKAAVIEEKNAKVSKKLLPIVWGHKTAIKLLFQNLVGNGLKYQAVGNQPVLEVDYTETEDKYIVSFKDNGIGISEENHRKVFNLFSRLHTKSEFSGTGMGLATCQKIVALHDGKIWVESTLNNGSIFYLTLPKKNAV